MSTHLNANRASKNISSRLLFELEAEHTMKIIQKACFEVLAAVDKHSTPVTVNEIAYLLKCSVTPGLTALTNGLVDSGYLTQVEDGLEIRYELVRHKKGSGLPKPRLPLPYYVGEQDADENWIN